MALNVVYSNTPGVQAITKLNENDLINSGEASKGRFNKNELDDLYTHLSNIRQYERDVKLGNTLSSYTNWTHVDASDGYSVWGYPVSDYVHSSVNEMYRNDIKLSYQGVASSESTMSGFDSVQISNSKRSGATYVDHTAEATSTSGTPFTMVSFVTVTNEVVSAVLSTPINLDYTSLIDGSVSLALQTFSSVYSEDSDFTIDYINGTVTCLSAGTITSGAQLYISYNTGSTMYLGLSNKFDAVNLTLATKGVGNQLTYTYSSGSSNWASFTPTLDSTNAFSNNGNITWTASSLTNWTTDTVNGSASKYWIRIQTSQYGMILPTAYTLARADSAATKLLSMSQTDLNTNAYKWCYYNNNVYVAIPNNGSTVNEGVNFIKSTSTSVKKQNYFVYNNEYLINYYNTTSGQLEINNSVFVSGDLTVGGNFNLSGNINMSGNLSLSGRIFVDDGTSAAPSFTFRTASDTGWFLDATGKLCATVDGDKVLSLSSGSSTISLHRKTVVSGVFTNSTITMSGGSFYGSDWIDSDDYITINNTTPTSLETMTLAGKILHITSATTANLALAGADGGHVYLSDSNATSDQRVFKLASDGTNFTIQALQNDGTVASTPISITHAGIATFSSFPITPSTAPSTNYQTANKKYVDDQILTTDTLQEVCDNGNTTTTAVEMAALTATTGTFSGNVEIDGSVALGGSYVGSVGILQVNQDTNNYGIKLTSDDTGLTASDGVSIFIEQGTKDFLINQREAADIKLYTGSTVALTIDDSQKATFASDLSVGGDSVIMDNLPTSDPSTSGQLWNDSGTLKISAG